jgi:hypothetical protein
VISVHDAGAAGVIGDLTRFRREFYGCLHRRADVLFELTDAVLCADGPVTSLVGLSLAAEHRRGHGATFDAVNAGRLEVGRLRRALAGLPVPRDCGGRIVLAVDVSAWLRPDAATAPDRSFCHVYGRGRSSAQLIPGWPSSACPRRLVHRGRSVGRSGTGRWWIWTSRPPIRPVACPL